MGISVLPLADPYRRPDGSKKHDPAKTHHPTGTDDFLCIDGEGVTIDGVHRYVLLGAGQEQIEDSGGLHWRDVFDFLYSKYQPRVAFTGFYLGYDFTQWLKSLPEDRARKLLTRDGKESRRSQSENMRGMFLPVDVGEWQIDVIGAKRLDFRRRECDCPTMKCPHPKGPWMHVCDSGGFFQTSFLNVIDPKNWQEPIVSDEEYELIKRGKEKRESAQLDDEMRFYNRLENEILARVLHDLDTGFRKLDINLSPKQWFGAGQAAQAWLHGRAPRRSEVVEKVPEDFLDAARCSYFGGWFELQAHGVIPGTSYEYDINSAYPDVISRLPCLMHGTYTRGTGKPPPMQDRDLCLVRALVWGRPPDADTQRGQGLGAMLHRDHEGRISRPLVTAGWYWLHELQAAQRAKCITRIPESRYYEWIHYRPCDCKPPIWQIRNLYQMRLDVGKKSSLGKAAKTSSNSVYGKVAQSVGDPRFGNAVYASLITAGCRIKILDAIATHPGGKSAVVMVATDAVYFLTPHPTLVRSKALGDWEAKEREWLTLFKPGVYWDDETRAIIKAGEHPSFKARGVNAREFASAISRIDDIFQNWGTRPPAISDGTFTAKELEAMGVPFWPRVTFTSGFAMVTALQALMRNRWEDAGRVDTGKELVQDANPGDKRRDVWLDTSIPGRPIYRSEPLLAGRNATYRHLGNVAEWDNLTEDFSSVPYEKRFGLDDPFSDEVIESFGVSPDERQPFRGAFRVLTGQE